MSRLALRRDHILPGPLRSLQQERRVGAGVLGSAFLPLVALALAGAASLAVLPRLAARPSADPVRSVALPDAPAKVAAAPEAPTPVAASEPPAAAPAVKPETPGRTAADPAAGPPVGRAARPAAAPETTSFRLDMLPVLQAGLDLDAGPAARQAAARPSRSARRTAASTRDAGPAAGEPAQP